MNNLFKKCVAEFIGTFVLVFCACGVAVTANAWSGVVTTALAFGLVIVAMAYSIGRISGCHINPAVSFGMLLTKKMSAKDFLFYVIAQVLGAFVGGLLVFGILKASGYVESIANACNHYVNYSALADMKFENIIGALATEIVLTCIFVYVILNVTDKKSKTEKIAGIVIGLTLTLVHLVGIPLTGTSVNPARSLAAALGNWIYNGSTDSLAMVWVFIVGPMIGAAVAALGFHFLHEKGEKEVEETTVKVEE